MSDNRKYWYIKLKETFFEDDAILLLESMPDGYIYENVLLKFYLRSLKNSGKLIFNNKIPYNATMLSRVVRHPVGVVEKAIQIFQELGLVEILDNGTIYMSDIQNYIGKSSTEADRIRSYRAQIASEKALEKGVCTNVQHLNTIVRDRVRDRDNKEVVRKTAENDYNPFAEWEKIVGLTLTEHLAEKVQALYDEVGQYAFDKALKKSVENNVRKYKYIEAVARGIAEGNDYDDKPKAKRKEEINSSERSLEDVLTPEQLDVYKKFEANGGWKPTGVGS